MQIIERIFLSIHKKDQQEVLFSRSDIEKAAATGGEGQILLFAQDDREVAAGTSGFSGFPLSRE